MELVHIRVLPVYRSDPERKGRACADEIAKCARLRSAYQDQQAAGLMTIEELGSKLRELDKTRLHAERELAALKDSYAIQVKDAI